MCLQQTRELPIWCDFFRRARSGQAYARPRHGQPTADTGSHGNACINDASGVRPKPGPGRSKPDSRCTGDREIDAGEPGGGEPPRRVSGRPRRRERGHWCEAPCRADWRQHRQCRRQARRRKCGGRCAGIGADDDAPGQSMVQRRMTRTRNASAIGGAGARARREARARCRRCRARGVRTGKRTVPPPERRHGPRGAAVRPRAPGCRAGARGRRGSR